MTKKKILVIHTGGTIGMTKDLESGVLKPDMLYESLMKVIPELSDIATITVEIPFITDSSQIGIPHWREIAGLISRNADSADGVVIAHGTDTLAYTASALSYMLMNAPLPVILTGAQKPLSELRTDARANFINAVQLACSPEIREVAIFFDDKLMRGNRTIKAHINHFDAFHSPNYPLLAKTGIDVEIYRQNLLTPGGLFHVFDQMDSAIAIYKAFPGCSDHFFQPGEDIRAIMLLGFGAGTFPIPSPAFLERVESWIAAGKIVVVASETRAGKVDPRLYESGAELIRRGALHTGDMTFEAAITKLMFLLGQYREHGLIRKNFTHPLAGEISE